VSARSSYSFFAASFASLIFFGLVVFLKGPIHVDGADFHGLRENSAGERKRGKNSDEDKLFHRCKVRLVIGMGLECKCHLSFKIGNRR